MPERWWIRPLILLVVIAIGGAVALTLDALLQSRGLLAVIGVRLVPVVPFSAVNYACGLSGVRFRDYLPGTAVGIVPATTVYVTLGAYGAEPGSVPFLLALGGLAVLVIGSVVVARRRRRAPAGTAG